MAPREAPREVAKARGAGAVSTETAIGGGGHVKISSLALALCLCATQAPLRLPCARVRACARGAVVVATTGRRGEGEDADNGDNGELTRELRLDVGARARA